MTVGVPAILTRDVQATGKAAQTRFIVDREGMAAQFLADLVAAGRTVTVLRTDQYANLESFTEVGAFVPLEHDQQGNLIREVAAACFALPLPDQPGASLPRPRGPRRVICVIRFPASLRKSLRVGGMLTWIS